LGLPGFMGDVVAGVDGEVVGLVDVVLGVGIEGADADFVFGGEVGDGDGFAGHGIGAAVDGGGELAEGRDPRALPAGAVGADEVVLEAAAYGADLGRGGGVGDDAVGRRCEGCAGMGLVVGGRGCDRGCGWRCAWRESTWAVAARAAARASGRSRGRGGLVHRRVSARRIGVGARARVGASAWGARGARRLGEDGCGQDGEGQ